METMMKNKKCKVVLLILCLSLSILFGCTNDSKERDNSDTNTENTDSVDNTENPVNKLKDNDASKEDSTNISGPIVMKVSEAFDLPEKRVWNSCMRSWWHCVCMSPELLFCALQMEKNGIRKILL